jgi:urease accessory protein
VTAAAQLYRLMTWLSPSFPVGAFSYSHGLEWAVESGAIRGEPDLAAWIADLLQVGSGWNDAVLCVAAWRSADAEDWDALADLAELAGALVPSVERRLETLAQGSAFTKAIQDAWPCVPLARLSDAGVSDLAYPVAVGAAAAGHGMALGESVQAFLHAFVANLVSAGVRLIPLGQTAGLRILAALEGAVGRTGQDALAAGLERLGGIAFASDIASMNHETQYSRLFRS